MHRCCRKPRWEWERGSGGGRSGSGLHSNSPLKTSKALQTASYVCACEPRLGRGYWHKSMCTMVVLGRSVTFLVACPKGFESLLGWLLGRERKTLDNDSHSQ